MKKVLGFVFLSMVLSGICYADYNWASWYNQNPSITGNLSVGGWIKSLGNVDVGGKLTVTGTETVYSSSTFLGNGGTYTKDQVNTKHLNASSTWTLVGNGFIGSGGGTGVRGDASYLYIDNSIDMKRIGPEFIFENSSAGEDDYVMRAGDKADSWTLLQYVGDANPAIRRIRVDGVLNAIEFQPNTGLHVASMTATLFTLPGDMLVSSRPCATFEYFLNASSVTEITAGTWTIACGTGTLIGTSAWFNNVADTQGNNNRLTYVGPNTHKFRISVSGCLQTPSATATTPSIRIIKNGVFLNLAETSPYLSTQSKDTPFAVQTIGSLATNDYIEVQLTTDDSDDLAIDHMQVNIISGD
jgi:hypothetical protein